MQSLLLFLIGLCSAWVAAGAFALLLVTRNRRRAVVDAVAPGVSILKPLCGLDPDLEENLQTFLNQDHAPMQIVFGVESAEDPALPVVRQLAADRKEMDIAIVVHGGGPAINPKVNNLQGMVGAAKYDLLLISDANVRAPSDYVRRTVETYIEDEEETGLVTNVFVGTGEQSLGAALENVQLNGFVAAGAALPTLAGDAAVVGKSMLFSRTRFDRLGGFASVRDLLAEDFMIGKMFQHAGYQVQLGPTVLRCKNARTSVGKFLRRQLRWSMLRIRLRPLAFALEPVTNPLVLAMAASTFLGVWAWAWLLAVLFCRDTLQWIVLRGFRRAWLPILLGPLRDLLMIAVWIETPFRRHVAWRGHRVRLGAGTHAFLTDDAAASVGAVER